MLPLMAVMTTNQLLGYGTYFFNIYYPFHHILVLVFLALNKDSPVDGENPENLH